MIYPYELHSFGFFHFSNCATAFINAKISRITNCECKWTLKIDFVFLFKMKTKQTWHGYFKFFVIDFSHAFDTLESDVRTIFKSVPSISRHKNNTCFILIEKQKRIFFSAFENNIRG